MLAHHRRRQGAWTPEQSRLAFDLLGTPTRVPRGIKPGVRGTDLDGRLIEYRPTTRPPSLAREIDALKQRREVVEGHGRGRTQARSPSRTSTTRTNPEPAPGSADTSRRHLMRLRWCLLAAPFRVAPSSGPSRPHAKALAGMSEPESRIRPTPDPEPERRRADGRGQAKRGPNPPFDLEATTRSRPPGEVVRHLPADPVGPALREDGPCEAEARRESRRRAQNGSEA